ncbi:MAG: type IV pilin protein [Synechococcus sp.]
MKQAQISSVGHHSGFTLIELMVVMVVIGVLTAVAIPSLASQVDRARMAAAVSEMKSFADGIHSFAILNGAYPGDNHEAVPAGTDGYINGTAFMNPTPLGGRYNFDNSSGGGQYVGISISSFNFPVETRERLDALVDGEVNLGSGIFIDSGHSPARPTLLIERCNDGAGLC